MEDNYYSKGRKQVGFFSFLRDIFIAKLPLSPNFVCRFFLPYSPDFIFLTHPRNDKDILATFPLVRFLNIFLPSSSAKAILKLAPCYIVAKVKGPKGKRGYVVTVPELPETLFVRRELTQSLVAGCVTYFKRIAVQETFVGLAAWWPIVSNAGKFFSPHLKDDDFIRVTTGHTATLASLYLSVLELIKIIKLSQAEASILILGVGKVGGALAHLLAGKLKRIGIVDKNKIRISSLKKKIESNHDQHVEGILVGDSDSEDLILKKINDYDITVCTTSNTGLLISDGQKLKNCIILDDSRPEAFPRIFSDDKKVVVLEGGLMKVPEVYLDSDFGIGQDENVFGCLAEAIILSLDIKHTIKPNIGELDYDNLFELIKFCKEIGITIGDFKCAQEYIKSHQISHIFSSERQY